MKYLIMGFVGILGLAAVGYMQSRAGYETAEYKVVSKDGNFEVRDYSKMMIVSATDERARIRSSSAFRSLFGYISGSNSESAKISMTSPVFMSADENGGKMSFVVPKEVADRGAPLPTGEGVTLEEMPGGKFAALRFNGALSNSSIEEMSRELRKMIEEKKLKTEGRIFAAGYDPPYTPRSLRRNEVLIRLKK